jgi:hypothetical protein
LRDGTLLMLLDHVTTGTPALRNLLARAGIGPSGCGADYAKQQRNRQAAGNPAVHHIAL